MSIQLEREKIKKKKHYRTVETESANVRINSTIMKCIVRFDNPSVRVIIDKICQRPRERLDQILGNPEQPYPETNEA